MADQHQEWLDFAKSVALEAGDIMRKYFGKKPDSHLKANNTIVTVADEEINDLVIKRVTERYPAHDIDGEEASQRRGSKYVWACDPIDGTTSFIMGLPVSVFSLALVIDGQSEVGVIYAPFSDHLYWASRGCGVQRVHPGTANLRARGMNWSQSTHIVSCAFAGSLAAACLFS